MVKKLFIFTVVLILHFTFTIENCDAQWSQDVRLTNAPGDSYTSWNNARCIESNGNVVHTVWYDERDGNNEIYYKRSTDGGTTWGADFRLTNNASYSMYPSIAINGSLVHVVWRDERDGNNEIYYKRSSDGGINWGADTRLTNNNVSSDNPSIAVSDFLVHVVWEDIRDGNREIYYKRSSDGGINWGADTRLTNNTAFSYAPSIVASGSLVHVVWEDDRNGYPNYEIYYKRSSDGGSTWVADTRLTNNSFGSNIPSIAVSGSHVHTVWTDNRDGNLEIYYKRSTDEGLTWGLDTRLTNNSFSSAISSIAVSGSLLHIAWRDDRDGNWEIFYKRSIDGGINWEPDIRLTNYTSDSFRPSIAVSGSQVHVVFSDLRDGNWEIYYKRNTTGNLIGIQSLLNEIPSAFSLEQNYPNPFNPNTNIKFKIVKSGNVKLIVFDILGKVVATLVNESLQPGTYESTFDASNLSSGIYFYKLQTDCLEETRKMLMIK